VESNVAISFEPNQRFDLRNAAGQITRQFLVAASKEIEAKPVSAPIQLIYDYDGDEATLIAGKREISIPAPEGDYFGAVEDVSIQIIADFKRGPNVSIRHIDAVYHYSDEDLDDCGMIVVTISLSSDVPKGVQQLQLLEWELRGHLAHEMQHSIQKMVYGWRLSGVGAQHVESHMRDTKEIDARVEEIIAQLKEGIDENDITAFTTGLRAYIGIYLEQNLEGGRADPRYLRFYGEMLNTHLRDYERKLKVEPTHAAN
jgi:hypothetical protein